MGKLLQAGGYEEPADEDGWMAPAEDKGNLLETMEEGQDTVPDDKAIQSAGLEGTRTGQLPKRDMESSTNAKPNPDKQRNSPPRLYKPDELLRASMWKLENRRVPNGTHGGVRGRLVN